MKLRYVLPLILCVLSGCNTFKAETPEQRLYALKSEYQTVLQGVVVYKDLCFDHYSLDSTCRDHVEVIRKVDNTVAAAFEKADAFRKNENYTDLTLALSAARSGLDVLTNYLKEVHYVK